MIEERMKPLLAVTQGLFDPLALGDIFHDATQFDHPSLLNKHGYEIPNPHGPAVGSQHAVFEGMCAMLANLLNTVLRRPGPVLGMDVVHPEGRRREPLFD